MLADLDIRHLLALRAVADEGTFGRAADRLGFTQSAVSQQVAALERLVGMQLFDRQGGPRPPVLTPAGHTLLGHAITVLDQLDRAVDELDRLRRGVSGTLTVGAFQSITVKALPAVVARFRADVPDVELRIVQSDVQADLLDKLERGDIDLLFVVGDIDPRFDVAPLGHDPYVALLPGNAPEGPYDITTLSGTPTVGQPADDVCQLAVVRALDRLGISPNYVFRSVDNSAVQSMVRSGMGPAIMPFLCVDPLDPDVSVRELDPAIEPRTIGIASVPRTHHHSGSGPVRRDDTSRVLGVAGSRTVNDDPPVPPTFTDIITLEPHGTDVWVGATGDYPWGGRIYGGQVIAQGLRAAQFTVDEAVRIHSVHAYFIRPGTTTEPVRYEVDRIRNGRSFATRRVVARQSGGAILNLSASYQVDEDEPDTQVVSAPEDVPGPDELPQDGWGFLIDRRAVSYEKGAGRATGWVRILDPIADEPGLAACGLAFTSDTIQFGAARTAHPNGQGTHGPRDLFMGASLDHAIWFHRPVDPTEWHLYEVRSHGLVNGRGLVVGDVFDQQGTHVATMSQELLLRVRRS